MSELRCEGDEVVVYVSPTGDCHFVPLPGVPTHYVLEDVIPAGTTISLGAGASMTPGYDVGGILEFQEGSVLRGWQSTRGWAQVLSGGTLRLNGARVENAYILLSRGAHLEGTQVTLAEDVYFVLDNWSGSTAEAFSGIDSLTVEAETLKVELYLSGDCSLAALPGVQVHYVAGFSETLIPAGRTVTLEAGASLGIGAIYGTLVCRKDSVLTSAYVYYTGGVLRLDGARVEEEILLENGSQLEGGATFCREASLWLRGWEGSTADMLSGLSQTTLEDEALRVRINPGIGDDCTLANIPGLPVQYELSGGIDSGCTVTLEDGEHRYRITAADAHGNCSEETGSFSLDNSVPRLTEVTAPAALANAKKGKAKVTLAWACSEPGASFTVVVDGKAVYSGSKTSCTVQLTDEREHHYTIIATDEEGNTSTPKSGSFRFDATAPVLKLQAPTFTRVADGQVAVNFAWSGHEEGLSCTLTLDKEATPIWEGSTPHPTLILPDGKHNYTLTATDVAGNSTTVKGSYAVDATAPVLTIKPTKLKTSKKDDRVTATLSWKGEGGCSYAVRVGEEEISTGTKASYAHSFMAGESFSYQVIATDKAGNSTTSEWHTVRCDVSAPELSGLAHEMTLGADGLPQTTLRWHCEDESAVSYTIKVDGKAVAGAGIQDDGGGWFRYVHTTPLKGCKQSDAQTTLASLA